MSIFYRPADGVAGDFIPFFDGEVFHLFYLKDLRQRSRSAQATPWMHLVTTDFVHFEDRGEALSPGPAGAQDESVWTGSVIEANGLFYAFYTGHNASFDGTSRPTQAIMRATSHDLNTW